MKGISKFANYSFIILISFAALGIFVTLIYGYYDHIIKTNIQVGLKQIAVQTSDKILYLYDQAELSNANPANSTSVVISSIDLNYPTQVMDRNFEVELLSSPGIWNAISSITIEGENVTIMRETSSSAKVIAKTTQRPIETYEYDIPNVPIRLQGKYTSGDDDTLQLMRYNYNGDLVDTIILGSSTIIIGITSIR